MAISNQDIVNTLDLTGQASVSASDINQVTSTAVPAADKGLVIFSADVANVPVVPNASTTTKWQRYLWLRYTGTVVTAYTWNPTGTFDATLLYWNSAFTYTIPANSITTAMLQALCVTNANIAACDWSKLTSIPATMPAGGAAGGVLAGAYPNPTLANLGVTTAALALGCVIATSIANQVVDPVIHFSITGYTALQTPRINAAGTAWEMVTNLLLSTLANPAAGNALQIVQVNPAGNGFQYVGTYAKSVIDNNVIPGSGGNLSFAHTFTAIPQGVRLVLHCITADTATAYAIGDEINLSAFTDGDSGIDILSYIINNTNIVVQRLSGGNPQLPKKGTGVSTSPTNIANFVVKAYCQLYN